MKQTHQLFLDKLITPQGFRDLYNPAEERLNQLLGELPKLEADVAGLKVNQVSAKKSSLKPAPLRAMAENGR